MSSANVSTFKVRSLGAATVAAMARKCCHYNRIPPYLTDLFTLCGSSCGNGNASKWLLSLFLQLQQWQTNTVLTVICHCRKCSYEHFHVLAAEKSLPLPHHVIRPLRQNCFPSRVFTLGDVNGNFAIAIDTPPV